jgi:hypothetical protein
MGKEDIIAEAQKAQLVRSELSSRFLDREYEIVSGLVRKYRGGNLSDIELRSGIAAISELRLMIDELDTEIAVKSMKAKETS